MSPWLKAAWHGMGPWKWIGIAAIATSLLLTPFQAMSRNQTEARQVDGARALHRFRPYDTSAVALPRLGARYPSEELARKPLRKIQGTLGK